MEFRGVDVEYSAEMWTVAVEMWKKGGSMWKRDAFLPGPPASFSQSTQTVKTRTRFAAVNRDIPTYDDPRPGPCDARGRMPRGARYHDASVPEREACHDGDMRYLGGRGIIACRPLRREGTCAARYLGGLGIIACRPLRREGTCAARYLGERGIRLRIFRREGDVRGECVM